MKRKVLNLIAPLALMFVFFASASPLDGLTGRITPGQVQPVQPSVIQPGSALEATFDCLHDAAASGESGAGC